MRRFLAFGLVFAMLLAGAALPAAAQDTLKIGAPQPMTGPDAPFGDKFKKAYGMAVEEINAKGGVNGKKIEVIIDDHQAKILEPNVVLEQTMRANDNIHSAGLQIFNHFLLGVPGAEP